MKIAFLWMGLSGYLNACLRELGGCEDVELFVCHSSSDANAPFDEGHFSWIRNQFTWSSRRDLESLGQKLREFDPDILVFSGWHVPGYRRAAREQAKKAWRVMALDRFWIPTLKQRIGSWLAPVFVRPLADAIWVPGERQAAFAKKLGFSQQVILRGLYSCDQPAVSAVYSSRISERRSLPRSFLFVGRLVPEKCIDTLVSAYRMYRQANTEPWPLVCCGIGPLQYRLENEEGIRLEGFVQPERLPQVMSSAGCLVLPSRVEPWGLVVHEAAAAGMLILASENVGAVTHLVQAGYNGFIFDTDDVAGLAALMSRVAAMSDAQLDEMSQASHLQSRQFSPKQWANTLLQSFYAQSWPRRLGNSLSL